MRRKVCALTKVGTVLNFVFILPGRLAGLTTHAQLIQLVADGERRVYNTYRQQQTTHSFTKNEKKPLLVFAAFPLQCIIFEKQIFSAN